MRRLVPLLAAVAVVGAAYGLAACGGSASGPSALADDAGWSYVGDGACQQCHADMAATYAQTGMGRSVGLFDPTTAPERFDPDGTGPVVCADDGYCYQALVRADSLVMRETRPDTPGYEREQAVSHVVGSGNATRSYMMAAGGDGGGEYLTEMPLTWYVEREIWDLSPGYAQQLALRAPDHARVPDVPRRRPGHETSQNFYTDVAARPSRASGATGPARRTWRRSSPAASRRTRASSTRRTCPPTCSWTCASSAT